MPKPTGQNRGRRTEQSDRPSATENWSEIADYDISAQRMLGSSVASPTASTQRVPKAQQGFQRGRPQGRGQVDEGFVRVRVPKEHEGEMLGIIEEHYGSKLKVRCLDGHMRVCRIPGKIRYKLRVRMGDVILVKKWTVQSDEKGDYLYRYKPNQIQQLMRKGLLSDSDLEG